MELQFKAPTISWLWCKYRNKGEVASSMNKPVQFIAKVLVEPAFSWSPVHARNHDPWDTYSRKYVFINLVLHRNSPSRTRKAFILFLFSFITSFLFIRLSFSNFFLSSPCMLDNGSIHLFISFIFLFSFFFSPRPSPVFSNPTSGQIRHSLCVLNINRRLYEAHESNSGGIHCRNRRCLLGKAVITAALLHSWLWCPLQHASD